MEGGYIMSLLHGLYIFQLQKTSGTDRYLLTNPYHGGQHNDDLFDLIAYKQQVIFKRIAPVDIDDGYLVYPIRYGEGNQANTLLFETAFPHLFPFGVVKIEGSNDAVLFEIVDDTKFYVWVSKNNVNQIAQLLSMMREGELLNEMEWFLQDWRLYVPN
jgi:hypothetical protein